MPPFSPQPFGKYYLVDKLAVGGMAEVFLARPPQGGTTAPRYLAIKRILPHFSNNAQFIDMFIDEAKISVQLEHENIVPVYDLGKIGETYFLAMEFVAGQDLKAIVTRCRDRGVRLSYEHAAWIVAEFLKGLDYAHKKADRAGRPLGIVHRDISPQNVLVGYDGSVKITDFGIAKAESKLDSTQVGTLKGKFGYMAPEQVVAGGPPLDHRSDLFAAGVILWELVTGHRLFAGTSEIEILERVRAAKFDPPSSVVPDVPRELERIIFKSLMKDREKRYGSAYEMQVDLSRFLATYAPQFNQAELSAVMEELFSAEIALAKSRWNVVVGPVIDKTKVERGDAAESTRPDQTRVSVDPVETREPVKTRIATPAPAVRAPAPPAGAPPPPRGATPPPMRNPDSPRGSTPAPMRNPDAPRGSTPAPTRNPDAPRAATPPPMRNPDDARVMQGRTAISAPVTPPPKSAALRPEDLFDDGSPFGDGAEDEKTTSQPFAKPDRADVTTSQPRVAKTPTPSPARTAAPPPAASDPEDGLFAEPTTTMDTAPLRKAGKNAPEAGEKPRRGVRASYAIVLVVVLAFGAAFVWMGVFPNPFAPPMIEVVATMDAMISVDGNVVLASGRSGTWRVGEGERVVEVRRQGYQPFTKKVTVHRGDQVFVDATLVPLPDSIADIPVESDPPGAKVFVDDQPVDGVTPVTVHEKLGDHRLRLTRDGYGEITEPIRATHPGLSNTIRLKLLPAGATLQATSTPEGAEVFVDGVSRGVSPVTVSGLTPGKKVVVTFVLAGYRNEDRTVSPPAGEQPLEVSVTMTKGASTTPSAAAATPSSTPALAPTATPAAAAVDPNRGFLSLSVSGGWAQVFVDGNLVARKTPLEKLSLSPGTYTVRVFNPVSQREKIFPVTIAAGKTLEQTITLE